MAQVIKNKSISLAPQLTKLGEGYDGLTLLQTIVRFGGTPDDLAATGFEEKFGAWFAEGKFGTQFTNQFVSFFPNSKYTKMIEERRARQDQEVAKQKEDQDKIRAIDSDFGAMTGTVQQIVTLRFQAGFATKHADLMRNPARGLRAAEMVKAEANRLQQQDFCPAKRAFVKSNGTKAFQDRAKEFCENNPPTASAEFGREVTLTKECLATFSGC